MKDTAASTATQILSITRKLLRHPDLTVEDNFFIAGVHSMMSMQLVIKLRNLFGVELTLGDLFGAPTVSLLADIVDQRKVESRMRSIWGDLTGVVGAATNASFFALGGSALSLKELQVRVNAEWGHTLTLDELAENDTIARQAQLVRRRQFVSELPIVPGVLTLRMNSSRTPIFWTHYLSANLTRAMPDDQPFIHVGLVTDDLEALGESPDLHAVATCFMAKILATRKSGPYIIGGSCLGGILAFEIASQLRSAGHDVKLLVMIDTPSPSYFRTSGILSPKLTQPGYVIKRLRSIGLQKTLRKAGERLSGRINGLVGRQHIKTEVEIIQSVIENSTTTYEGARYDGEAALILAADHAPHIDFLSEWSRLIPDTLHSQYIAAHHSELMAVGGVQRVANAINLLIRSSEGPATNSPERLAPTTGSNSKSVAVNLSHVLR